MEEEGSVKGERKSIRLSAFIADIQRGFVISQLLSLHRSIRRIFKFRLNCIHILLLQSLRCSSIPHTVGRK